MWPVSNVGGLSSACTSRLPGQPVRLRFERVVEVGEYETATTTAEGDSVAPSLTGAVNGFRKLKEDVSSTSASSSVQATGSKTHKMLLTRCRDVLRQYTSEHDVKSESIIPATVADRVLEAIADASAPLDSKTLELVMNAYLVCRKPEGAIKAFEAAVGLAADGSSTDVDVVIGGKKTEGSRVVADVSALDMYTGTSLLRAHALRGDYNAARRVLAAMEGEVDTKINDIDTAKWPGAGRAKGFKTDSRCYNIALAAAAKAGGLKGMGMAVDMFDTMSEPGSVSDNTLTVGPEKNLVSYNTMINMLAKNRRKQDAFTIFYSMQQAGVKPDKISYTALIKASVESSDIDGARILLSDMIEDEIFPDVVTYNTIIKGLCDRYRWFEAKSLVSEMESYGINPNTMTYSLLMNGLIKADKPAACLTLFEAANVDERTSSLTENVRLYTTAITAAAMVGDNERALGFIARMTQAGIKPNLKTFTALMNALIASGKTKLAVDVFNKMDEPDGFAITLAIRAHCDAGNFASAAALLTEQRDGYKVMSGRDIMTSYNYIILSSLQQEKFDAARNALSELLQGGYIPSKETFKNILTGLDLLPQKGKMAQNAVKKDDRTDGFDFLLFVLDAIDARKIACNGYFYSAILLEGARLGGLRKKIASYLADARALTLGVSKRISVDECPVPEDEVLRITWEILLERYSEFKNDLGFKCLLPNLQVRVGKNEIRQVLASEQSVVYGSYRMRAARRFEI
uniref:Pentacotripeptide-repeat region of PRORP domain-containing protein n=1 Tax=Ditylum brightwellii TaxID=49249 RepID=A0A7S2E6V1_9STRA